jgi:hypothetical protein
MTADIDVYFIEKPEGLKAFLEEQGYEFDSEASDDRVKSYDHKNGWPVLYFEVDNKEKIPMFKSLLNINYHADDFPAVDEAHRLADEITRRYGAYQYDENLDEFFGKDDIAIKII